MQKITDYIQLLQESQIWEHFITQYATSLLLFILTWFVLKLIKVNIISKLYQTAQVSRYKYDNLITNILNDITSFTYLTISLFVAAFPLQLSEKLSLVIQGLFLFSLVLEISRASTKSIDFFFKLKHKRSNKSQKTNVNAIKKIIQIFLFTFGVLAVVDNLGFDISTLVASLGIGGIAVALAAQSILGDLFSSIAIYLDRPFEVGDFIEITPEIKGTIKSIGIKSTRLKGPKGQEIIISNTKLTSAFVQNTGRINKRRVSIILGVDYKTPDKILTKIPTILEQITSKVDNTEFKLAFIKDLGDYSINYKFVYNVMTGSYKDYSVAHNQIMLHIKKEFDKNKINLSYPTQTIIIEKN
jgi:small-conductance mechanosensitive channel